MTKPTIFMSFSHADKVAVSLMSEKLRAVGYTVLEYTDIHANTTGNVISQFVYDGIQQSDIFVLILSPDSLNSQWVKQEYFYVGSFPSSAKKIIPIMIRECRKDLWPELTLRVYIDMMNLDLTSAWNRLLAAL